MGLAPPPFVARSAKRRGARAPLLEFTLAPPWHERTSASSAPGLGGADPESCHRRCCRAATACRACDRRRCGGRSRGARPHPQCSVRRWIRRLRLCEPGAPMGYRDTARGAAVCSGFPLGVRCRSGDPFGISTARKWHRDRAGVLTGSTDANGPVRIPRRTGCGVSRRPAPRRSRGLGDLRDGRAPCVPDHRRDGGRAAGLQPRLPVSHPVADERRACNGVVGRGARAAALPWPHCRVCGRPRLQCGHHDASQPAPPGRRPRHRPVLVRGPEPPATADSRLTARCSLPPAPCRDAWA